MTFRKQFYKYNSDLGDFVSTGSTFSASIDDSFTPAGLKNEIDSVEINRLSTQLGHQRTQVDNDLAELKAIYLQYHR